MPNVSKIAAPSLTMFIASTRSSPGDVLDTDRAGSLTARWRHDDDADFASLSIRRDHE